ncbi:MAG: TetR/AcrR family transcriptional regulator [Thermonemataceae bacterium]
MNAPSLTKQQKRFRIVAAAEKLFSHEGVEKVTMNHIAQEAKVGKGTLYLYFKSKEELYSTILVKAFDRLEAYFQEVYQKTLSGYEKVIQLAHAYLQFALQEPHYFDAILHYQNSSFDFDRLAEAPENAKAVQRGADLMQQIIQVIKTGQDDTSINPALQVEEVAFIIWGQLTGVLQIIKKKMDLVNYLQPLKVDRLLETQLLFIQKTLRN